MELGQGVKSTPDWGSTTWPWTSPIWKPASSPPIWMPAKDQLDRKPQDEADHEFRHQKEPETRRIRREKRGIDLNDGQQNQAHGQRQSDLPGFGRFRELNRGIMNRMGATLIRSGGRTGIGQETSGVDRTRIRSFLTARIGAN